MSRGRTWHRWTRSLADDGLAPTLVWFVLLILLADAWSRSDGPGDRVAAVGCVLIFAGWLIARDRLGRTGALAGVALVVTAVLHVEQLGLVLGAPVLAVSLPGVTAVVATLTSVVAYATAVRLAEPSALPTVLLGGLGLAVMLYLLLRISTTARHLRLTREDLARTEVDAERERLATELNRIIGQTLEQVARQTTLARSSLTVTDPVVHRQLADVEALVDHGLEQLRSLSHQPVIADLEAEIRTAQTLCPRLGVEITVAVEIVGEDAADAFALLLREAVTNMFKHADPTRCTLVIRQQDGIALFSFTHDGAHHRPSRPPTGRSGSGQRRWRADLEARGGTLETGPLTDDRYRVVARLPARGAQERSDSPRLTQEQS